MAPFAAMVLVSWIALLHADNLQNIPQKSRLLPYVGKSDKSFLNVKAEVCYCTFWTCYYCPANLFCTIDKSGCCSFPGCRNDCGKWCLCPEFPVCCPDGACSESKPRCCGKKCCAQAEICCKDEENHCCEDGSKCCGGGCCSDQNGKCCQSATSDQKMCCVKDSTVGDKTIENKVPESFKDNDVSNAYMFIFRYLCKTFGDLIPKKNSKQFAVLLVGDATSYKLQPNPRKFNLGIKVGDNYAAARFMGSTHTEDLILQYADSLVKKYTEKYKKRPRLFLYTRNNPCCGSDLTETCNSGCAGKIASKTRELVGRISTITTAWDMNYKMGTMPFDKAFLFSLNALLSPGNSRISWNTDGYCRQTPRGWFQMKMFTCLAEKVTSHPFCNRNSLQPDLARLVNAVTWECGTKIKEKDGIYSDSLTYNDDRDDDDVDNSKLDNEDNAASVGVPPARQPECWKEKVDIIDKASASKCSSLVKSAFDCATENQKEDLGPALDPEEPSTWSDSALDVRGAYKSLCFSGGSCQIPKVQQQYDDNVVESQPEREKSKEEL